ncbi:MAG: MBL fold metallo-hydrolase [SAR86 cluster bacterium]|jgi:glyoxylase-like metal-dependent hydrolase (beta-lactamase superfamily II)|nr:MBL fold metallo-hydrolase [SAR86 cluster bacterium]
MKLTYLFKSLFISLTFLAFLVNAAHHEESEVNYQDGQQAVMDAFGWNFDEAEITIEKISDNVHVLFGLGGNILVSTGDDGVLFVDDQMPELKYKILRSLRKIGGKSVDYVINTHWHFDHAEGNLAFGPDGAKIVAHENSRNMMLNPKPINLSFIVYPQQPYPLNSVPQITYQDTMKLHLNGEQIELYHFGHAHTTGDTAVFLRNSNVLHMGDVFNMTGPPFIDAGNGGSIDGIIRFCEEVLKVVNDKTIVVPGHGPISTTEDLQTYIDMLIVVRDRIQEGIQQGKGLQEIIDTDPTKEWRDKFGDGPFIVGVIDRAYAGMTK